jgi:hypothetical protein
MRRIRFALIVTNKQATIRVVVYWGLTLALIGTFFGLVIGAPVEPSIAKETVAGALGAAAGLVLGSLIGIVQLWGLRRKSPAHIQIPLFEWLRRAPPGNRREPIHLQPEIVFQGARRSISSRAGRYRRHLLEQLRGL